MKILIIDDEISAATTLQALLKEAGYASEVAYDGKTGLKKMADEPLYDLLILDVMMPDFSGIDVCRAMSQDEKLKKIPVLLASALPITSRELSELLSEFKASNVVKGAIEKPYVIEDMVAEIKKIVQEK
jgi:DNA-binding response OmpR family regulator